MGFKNVIFISLILIFALPVISASNINENIFENYGPVLEPDMDDTSDDEIDISEKNIFFEDIVNSNESSTPSSIKFSENVKEYEHVLYTKFLNESVDNPEQIDSIYVFNSTPHNNTLNISVEIELEFLILLQSYENEFYESNVLDLLIPDVKLFFDKVIFNDLTKDIITCSKKINGDYIYSIDNLIARNSFNPSSLSFFNFS